MGHLPQLPRRDPSRSVTPAELADLLDRRVQKTPDFGVVLDHHEAAEIATALRQADEAFQRGCLHQKHQDDVYVMELEAELTALQEIVAEVESWPQGAAFVGVVRARLAAPMPPAADGGDQ